MTSLSLDMVSPKIFDLEIGWLPNSKRNYYLHYGAFVRYLFFTVEHRLSKLYQFWFVYR